MTPENIGLHGMGWNWEFQLKDRVIVRSGASFLKNGTQGTVVWIGRRPRSEDGREFTYIDVDFDDDTKVSFMEPASEIEKFNDAA